jgi:hypothetical protein
MAVMVKDAPSPGRFAADLSPPGRGKSRER